MKDVCRQVAAAFAVRCSLLGFRLSRWCRNFRFNRAEQREQQRGPEIHGNAHRGAGVFKQHEADGRGERSSENAGHLKPDARCRVADMYWEHGRQMRGERRPEHCKAEKRHERSGEDNRGILRVEQKDIRERIQHVDDGADDEDLAGPPTSAEPAEDRRADHLSERGEYADQQSRAARYADAGQIDQGKHREDVEGRV